MKLGLYIHIPFCKSKCFYCDFCSTANIKKEQVTEYINALIYEIISESELLSQNEVDTIYIGGGTPSAIDAMHIQNILKVINSCTKVSDTAEITIELNPESITYEKLCMYKECGINRISLGLQTIDDNILKLIGRSTTKDTFDTAYKHVLKAGFTNISVDVMLGLPKDNIDNFKNTIEYILKLPNLKHISAYSLEVHEDTKLDFLIQNKFLTLPSSEEERNMKYMLDNLLKENRI